MVGLFPRRRAAANSETADAEPDAIELHSLHDGADLRRVNIINDAASSINIDEDVLNEDSTELVLTARQIIDRSLNWRADGRNDFDAYTVEAAKRVLENAPKQRHRFVERDIEHSKHSTASNAVQSSTLKAGPQAGSSAMPPPPGVPLGGPMRPVPSGFRAAPGFSDGFYNEAPSETSSIFTLNIDMDELPSSQTMRLSRSFRPSDFKWLCLTGGIPLGLFVGASNCIGNSGPLGTLLGFLIVVPGVLSVMGSLSEMIAFYPMEGGFPLLVSAYVERSLGFAVGICYWVSCALQVPAEVLKSVRLLSFYADMQNDRRVGVIWLTFILGMLFIYSCLTTRMASWSLKLASIVTAGCLAIFLVFMWVFDAGGVGGVPALGARFWHHPFMGHVNSKHSSSAERLFEVWHAISVALESYSGVEIPYTAMPEIRNPRRTVKSSMRLITVRVVVIYLLIVFSFTLVTSPKSLDYFKNHSYTHLCSVELPVILRMFDEGVFCTFFTSLASTGLCAVADVLNAFFLYQGVFAAGLKLFGATRTLHGLGISGLIWDKLAWCSRDSVPIAAAGISLSFLLFGYLILSVPGSRLYAFLTTFCIQMYLLVWVGLCIAYLRFHKAIRLQQPHTRISRNDEDYPYKSLWQPWTAIFGLIWCSLMLLTMAVERQVYTSIWRAESFVAGFLPFGIFGGAYYGYKWWYGTQPVRYDDIGLAAAKRQMDSEEWEEDRVYSDGFREKLARRWNRWVV